MPEFRLSPTAVMVFLYIEDYEDFVDMSRSTVCDCCNGDGYVQTAPDDVERCWVCDGEGALLPAEEN